jgi:PAS domain S-box-containing protein
MKDQGLSSLLMRQLRKLGLSETDMPQDLQTWKEFLSRINKAYGEYDEARISSENVLAVSLHEMELMQQERAKINADKLQELNANLSLVLQASELGVWDWNLETNEVTYDKRWCEILGYSSSEIEHKLQTFIDLTHPEDISRVLKLAQDYIDKKADKFDAKFLMKHKSGQWIHIHAKGKITKKNEQGKPLRFMGTHNDLTEETRIQKEVELQKNKLFHQSKLASLGEMSAGIAHEINNPLAIIAGSAEVLANIMDNPTKINAKRESILRSCDRISKILNGLKKFSRSAEQNEQRIFNLSSIIDEVIILTGLKASRFMTPVFKECSDGLSIRCDDLGIEQVLINLINNAIDAVSKNNERWVRITAHQEDQHVLLRVIDSGPVISSELENKIFDPFFTTKGVGEGTGLGLSITKGILDEHQATIALNRTFSTTCFEIRFLNSGENAGD